MKMHPNLKAALRILLMTSVAFLFGHVSPRWTLAATQTGAPARTQSAQTKQRSAVAVTGADTDQEPTSETQPEDQQLIERMRAQLDQEAMDRVRYGNSGSRGLYAFMEDFGGFVMFMAVLGSLLWMLRLALEHRRWQRMVKVQTETHTKLLDKFGSSQDMLAYMESEAGKRFLETPVFDAQNKRSMALPYGRILWSVQIGVIAAALGFGLLFLRGKVNADADVAFLVFGTLVLILGVGFLVSGGVSYGLAKYLGLMKREDGSLLRPPAHSSSS